MNSPLVISLLCLIVLVTVSVYSNKQNSLNGRVKSVLDNHWLRAVILLNRADKPSSTSELSKTEKDLLLSLSDEEWTEWEALSRECMELSKNYPNAFDELLSGYWDKIQRRDYYVKYHRPNKSRMENHDVAISSLLLDEVRLITAEPKNNLEKIEERHHAVQKIKKKYSKGYKAYCDNSKDGSPSDYAIIRDLNNIIELQRIYDEHKAFKGWEERQKSFFDTYRKILDEIRPHDGKYNYVVPFQKITLSGIMEKSQFKIWQGFCEHYCSSLLDKQETSFKRKYDNVSRFKNRTRYFQESVYDGILEIICKIDSVIKGSTLAVFVTRNNSKWSTKTYNYHYNYLRNKLTETEHPWCNIDELYNLENKEKYHVILIIDMITTNQELKMNSALVIESFKKAVPLIGYYSLLKEYEQDELLAFPMLLKPEYRPAQTTETTIHPAPVVYSEEEEVAFIKGLLSQIVKHSYFSYFALTNALIGEAVGAEETKKRWLDNPYKYFFKTKKSYGEIGGEYTVDGQQTWHDFRQNGNTEDLDDVAHFTYSLFKTMGLLGQFREKGSYAVDFMNQMGYLATY